MIYPQKRFSLRVCVIRLLDISYYMMKKYRVKPKPNGSSRIVGGFRIVTIGNGLTCQGVKKRLFFSPDDIGNLSDNRYVGKIDFDPDTNTIDIRFTNRYYVDSVLMKYAGISRRVALVKMGLSNRLLDTGLSNDFRNFVKEYESDSKDEWIESIRHKVDVKMSMI